MNPIKSWNVDLYTTAIAIAQHVSDGHGAIFLQLYVNISGRRFNQVGAWF